VLLSPRGVDELAAAAGWALDNAGCFFALGGGSNVLIADGIIKTPVILTTGMSGIAARISGRGVYLDCLAGTPLKNVLSLSLKNGWSGLEHAAGIPGTVGGAVAGNAGTSLGSVGSSVEAITAVERGGSIVKWSGRDIEWGYRRCSVLEDKYCIAGEVTFRLNVDDREKVASAMRSAMNGRKSQPAAARTAGCVFKNPAGDSAGRLLDASGCKGMSVGGARVSERHSNFIENSGGCAARDILRLAAMCRERVLDVFGTALDFEIRMLGIPEVSACAAGD
jgi:UDP-N-acetylmuramate dehydrogenase